MTVATVPAVEVELKNLVALKLDESSLLTNVVPRYTLGRYNRERMRHEAVICFTEAGDNNSGGGLGPLGVVQVRAGATLVDIFTTAHVKTSLGAEIESDGLARKLRKEIEREVNRVIGENHLSIAGLTHIELGSSIPIVDRSADPIYYQQRMTVVHQWVNANE